MPLVDVLRRANDLAWTDALYVEPGVELSLSLPVIIHDVDDVDEVTDLPHEVSALGWDYLLDVQTVQSVVANARAQRPRATEVELLDALRHYMRRDAFIDWGSAPDTLNR